MLKDMLLRGENAKEGFNANLAALGGISANEAALVVDIYFKLNIASIDYGIGTVKIKHNSFYDRDTIRSALNIAQKAA